MPVSYYGSGLVPAPFVTMQKSFVRDQLGNILHPDYTFTLKGTIVNLDNSLDSPGASTATGMEGVLAGQKYIRQVFSADSGLLSITAPTYIDATNNINAFCRIDNIQFGEGPWVNHDDYTITLKANALSGVANEISSLVDSYDENINIAENIDGTFGITHDLKAVGSILYNNNGTLIDPVQSAKGWVAQRRYLIDTNGNLTAASGAAFLFNNILSNISGVDNNFWNYSCVEGIGLGNRSWSLNESFLYYSGGSVREQWNASINFKNDDLRIVDASINGLAVGFGDRAANLSLRNSRAKTYFEGSISPNLYTRLLAYVPSGYTLNPVPTARQIGYERTAGVLNYTYAFIATSGMLFNNVISESIEISDTGLTNIVAIIPIPGRSTPLIQNMLTSAPIERSLNINIVYTPLNSAVTTANLYGLYLQKPNTDAICNALQPGNINYCKGNVENWNPIKRTYSRAMSWICDPNGILPSGFPNAISLPNG